MFKSKNIEPLIDDYKFLLFTLTFLKRNSFLYRNLFQFCVFVHFFFYPNSFILQCVALVLYVAQ